MPHTNAKSWKHIGWIILNAIPAFGLPFLLVNILKLSTLSYYIWLYIFSAAFIYYYARSTQLKWAVSLKPGWALGTIMGIFFGLAFLSLASTSRPRVEESFLSAAMLPFVWRGLLYGLASAVLISLLPFIIVWRAFAGAYPGIPRKLGVTCIAVVSIAFMSFLYNLGLSDFNQNTVKSQVGKSLIASVPTLVSGNPLAAPITNVFLQVSESVVSGGGAAGLENIETAKSQTTPGGID